MTDLESQRDELEALQSIYNIDEFKINEDLDQPGGQFFAYIDLPPSFKVVYKLLPQQGQRRDAAAATSSRSAGKDTELEYFDTEFLPPIVLYVTLPPNYPSEAKPTYLLSCKWLTRGKLSILCRHLDQLWEENQGMEVLYIWTQFLKEETLKFLDIENTLDVSVIYTKQFLYLERKKKKQERSKQLEMQETQKIADEKAKNDFKLQNQADEGKSTGRENSRRAVIVTSPSKALQACIESSASVKEHTEQTTAAQASAASALLYSPSDQTDKQHTENQAAGTTKELTDSMQNYPESECTDSSRFQNERVEREANQRYRQREFQPETKSNSDKVNGGGRGGGYHSRNQQSSRRNVKPPSTNQYREEPSHSADRNSRNHTKQYSKYNRYQNEKSSEKVVAKQQEEESNPLNPPGRVERKGGLAPDERTVFDLPLTESVCLVLQQYNQDQRVVVFARSLQECTVCFSTKQGSDCIQFDKCGHIFCKICITSYFEVQVRDGNVKSLKCLEDKCDTEANPSQVKQVLSAEVFAKYDAALLAATLDTMSDIVYCPRRSCQYPVSLEPEETMGCCPSCQYVFCIFCKMVYHGVEPCRLKTEEQLRLVNDYHTGSTDARSQLEKRYGRRQLQRLVDTVLSEQWVSANSQNCPRCNVSIEKSSGCNKMACWRCNTYFCWLCQAELSHASPYLHFNNPASRCFNRLFEGVDHNLEDDEDDDDFWFDLDEL